LDPQPPPARGDVVGKFGQDFVWTPEHWLPSELNVWRQRGDDELDTIVEQLRPGPALDVVQLAAEAAAAEAAAAEAAEATQTNVSGADEPAEARRQQAALAAWYERMRAVPDWVDWAQLARGQDVFLVHAPAAALSLYYLSLVGGFSAPLITRVLRATAYLTAPPTQVMRRLVDTGAMVAACVTGGAEALYPGGAGWVAALQVRVLHAKVRQRLNGRKYWQRDAWGVPINQEDLGATLLAFSYNVLVGIELVGGKPLPQQQQEDYLALWRYVGWLLGVESDVLDPCRSTSRSKAMLESVVMHLLEPDAHSVAVAHHLLKAPGARAWGYRAVLCRRFLGNPLADALQLPVPTSWYSWEWGASAAHLFMLRGYTALGHWSVTRRLLLRLHGRGIARYHGLWSMAPRLHKAGATAGQAVKDRKSGGCPFEMVAPPLAEFDEKVALAPAGTSNVSAGSGNERGHSGRGMYYTVAAAAAVAAVACAIATKSTRYALFGV
jgi:hypothetical protein